MCIGSLNLDLIVAVSAVIVSLFGIGAAIFFNRENLKLTKAHNAKSVKPILRHLFIETEEDFTLILSNEGLGPALINSILLNERANNTVHHWSGIREYFQDKLIGTEKVKVLKDSEFSSVRHLNVLSQSEELVLARLPKSPYFNVKIVFEELEVEIYYEDIYKNENHYKSFVSNNIIQK